MRTGTSRFSRHDREVPNAPAERGTSAGTAPTRSPRRHQSRLVLMTTLPGEPLSCSFGFRELRHPHAAPPNGIVGDSYMAGDGIGRHPPRSGGTGAQLSGRLDAAAGPAASSSPRERPGAQHPVRRRPSGRRRCGWLHRRRDQGYDLGVRWVLPWGSGVGAPRRVRHPAQAAVPEITVTPGPTRSTVECPVEGVEISAPSTDAAMGIRVDRDRAGLRHPTEEVDPGSRREGPIRSTVAKSAHRLHSGRDDLPSRSRRGPGRAVAGPTDPQRRAYGGDRPRQRASSVCRPGRRPGPSRFMGGFRDG